MDKMRPPPSLHSNFFSSLKQVENRLKSDQQSHVSALIPAPPQQLQDSSMESLSSPLHIHSDEPNDNRNFPTLQESSELPQAFLSCSPQFPPTHECPLQENIPNHQKHTTEPETNSGDDIENLIQLLGLSDCGQEECEEDEESLGLGCGSCHCEVGFYSKIARVKGPKCEKEVERMEGWIKHFLSGNGETEEKGKKIEPLRLSLLLLGKAAFVSQGEDGGFGGLDFPSAIEDFLMNDPPKTT